MHFSRDQETHADEYGLDALVSVYGHAGGATDFFDYVQKNELEPLILKYASTHPVSQERISHLQQAIQKGMIRVQGTKPKKI